MATAGNPNYNSTPTSGGSVGWSMLTPDGWVTSNDQTQNNLVSSPTPTNMPNQTTPTNGNTNNNMYNQVVDTLGQAKTGMTNAMNYQPMAFNQENLNQYLNPYTSEVIDRSLSNLEDARQRAIQNMQAKAVGAGAYGGSRHGVADSLTNQVYADRAGDLASNLNMQNINQALNQFNTQNQMGLNVAQNQMTGAGALSNLANMGFGMANYLDDKAYNRSETQRMLQQALVDKAQQQFGGFTGAGQQGLSALLSSLGIIPSQGTQTTTKNHGLFDYIRLLALSKMG